MQVPMFSVVRFAVLTYVPTAIDSIMKYSTPVTGLLSRLSLTVVILNSPLPLKDIYFKLCIITSDAKMSHRPSGRH